MSNVFSSDYIGGISIFSYENDLDNVQSIINNKLTSYLTTTQINNLLDLKLDIEEFDISFNEIQEQLNDLDNQFLSISGGTIVGDLFVEGSLNVMGGTTQIFTQQVEISNNEIILNSNQQGTPPPSLKSGIRVNRGDETDYIFQMSEEDLTFRIGEEGDTQPVATREDEPFNDGLMIWNSSLSRLRTNENIKVNGNNIEANDFVSSETTLNTLKNNVYDKEEVDTLIENIDGSNWEVVGNDIENRNSGKVIVKNDLEVKGISLLDTLQAQNTNMNAGLGASYNVMNMKGLPDSISQFLRFRSGFDGTSFNQLGMTGLIFSRHNDGQFGTEFRNFIFTQDNVNSDLVLYTNNETNIDGNPSRNLGQSRVRINPFGNMLIGTGNAVDSNYKLEVEGDATATDFITSQTTLNTLKGEVDALTTGGSNWNVVGDDIINANSGNIRIEGNIISTRSGNGLTTYLGTQGYMKFPTGTMTADTTTITSGIIDGMGTYVASASSFLSSGDRRAYRAFDNLGTNEWHTGRSDYNSTTGLYEGSFSLGGIDGEWIRIQLPTRIQLYAISLMPRSSFTRRTPNTFSLIASNDNSTWTTLQSVSNYTDYADNRFETFIINNSTPYEYYALVTGATQNSTEEGLSGNNTSLQIREWRLYGEPVQDKIILASNGNLGIGTTSPNERLDVNGNIRAETGNGEILITPTGWRTSNRATIKITSKSNNPAELDFRTTQSGGEEIGWHWSQRSIADNSRLSLWKFGMNTDGQPDGSSFVNLFNFFPSGRFGIGTTSPQGRFTIAGGENNRLLNFDVRGTSVNNDDYPSIWAQDSSSDGTFYDREHGHLFIEGRASNVRHIHFLTGINSDMRMMIRGDGKVLIGRTSPQEADALLDVNGGINCLGLFLQGAVFVRSITTIRTSFSFSRFRILDQNTNAANTCLAIGTTLHDFKVQLPNNSNNRVGRARANAWTTYSDRRIKSCIEQLNYGIEDVMKLKPSKYFQHNTEHHEEEDCEDIVQGCCPQDNPKFLGEETIGLIAQEVNEVIPELVIIPDDTTHLWGLDYDKLSVVCVKAIQDQQTTIEELREKVEDQQTTIEELRENINMIMNKLNL